jgi:hypothetical protein
MSLTEFREHQTTAEAYFATSPVFASLVPLTLQMYECLRNLAQPIGSASMGRLMMLCHREFLVAAGLIQRGLPYDAAANTRRAIEIAKLALALKKDPKNAEKWMKAPERQARWDARRSGQKPENLQSAYFPGVNDDPLYKALHDYFGMYSDAFVHFTPEFLGMQHFSESTDGDGIVRYSLQYLAPERTVLQHGITLCGLHGRILNLFDACFDKITTTDKGWQMLKTTFDQLGADLLKTLPPEESDPAASEGNRSDGAVADR